MDSSGYPDKKDLKDIATLAGKWTDKESYNIPILIDSLKEMWRWEDYCEFNEQNDGEWTLAISTGGWSGHENIMSILQGSVFWYMHWQSSRRGGHYIFSGKLIKDNK